MFAFIGGVRDANGARGFIPVAPNGVVAVDLGEGKILWRRERIGRPIAATPSRLVILEDEGKSFAVRLIDAATGRDAGRAAELGMPDWAAETGTAPDAVQVEISETANGIRVDWRLRRPYRGGAPPSDEIAGQKSGELAGAFLLNPDSAQTSMTESAPSAGPSTAAVPTALGPHASAGPNVLALDRVGDCLFTLKVQTLLNKSLVTLEARDARDGSLLWEASLAELEPSGPTPLRK